MERDANQMSQSPSLCRSGCGFYGSPKTDGLCSKCYKDVLKRKQTNPAPPPITPLAGRNSPTVTSTSASVCISTIVSESSEEKLVSAKDNLSTASPTVPSLIITPASQESESLETPKQAEKSDSECVSTSLSTLEKSEPGSSQQQEESLQKDSKKKKNRCHVCRKKVGLTGFSCRCSGLFCSLHRYSNEHNCTFDYKELGAQEIRKNNPLVVGEKIQKI